MLVLSKSGDVLLGPPQLQGKLKGETLRSFQTAIKGKEFADKLSGTSPSSDHNSLIETWPDGNQYLIGFACSTGYLNYPGLDWVVLVRQKTDIAFAPARSLQLQITIWGLVLGLLSASLSSLIASRVVSPMLALAFAADQIRSGDATVKIPVVRGRDEVAILSSSLSNLVAMLNLQKHDLHRLNEDLEMRVEQRTSQLQTANVSLKKEIAQRQHAQTKQAELLRQLESSNQDLSDFARIVSHDLKAPLRSIQTLASWISSD
ncbi:MAG: HAMP domain-containing protein [Potamolinea sp.]